MILYINTIKNNSTKIEVAICDNGTIYAKKIIKAQYQQAEKLLVLIDNLLASAKIKINEIKNIEVENYGGSFTALRIGIITANTLSYALDIPLRAWGKTVKKKKKTKFKLGIIKPIYNKQPNITSKNKKN